MREQAASFFRSLQSSIIEALESFEPSVRFNADAWDRLGGGGGLTRVLLDGDVIEKAGVNFSEVHGDLPEDFAKTLPGEGTSFWAAGVSLIIHPRNPYAPTVHANFRMLDQGGEQWFGGGADLTPYYPFAEDATHFHKTIKEACDPHDAAYYPDFKAWCDRYFYLPHREECRGIGGIFFDRLQADEAHTLSQRFEFVQDAGRAFLDAYIPLLQRRKDLSYGEREREHQLIRRGRYVEFNLVYDRGTTFGLKTRGRTESILVSMPPLVRWVYDYSPSEGSAESQIFEAIKPRDWASLEGETYHY
ncbi:MAG: oxygen-dependent coproporphyrinogen oxidase [Myxococcales bacterium]|nr:oxygen-dependent coproporphyrinogen oxidase [Myxococcales bacterium]